MDGALLCEHALVNTAPGSQPVLNRRRMAGAPFALAQAGQWLLLMQRCLCNLDWLQARCRAQAPTVCRQGLRWWCCAEPIRLLHFVTGRGRMLSAHRAAARFAVDSATHNVPHFATLSGVAGCFPNGPVVAAVGAGHSDQRARRHRSLACSSCAGLQHLGGRSKSSPISHCNLSSLDFFVSRLLRLWQARWAGLGRSALSRCCQSRRH